MAVLLINAKLRVTVSDKVFDSIKTEIVKGVASEGIPTLEDLSDEIRQHLSDTGNDSISTLVRDVDLWVDDTFTEE